MTPLATKENITSFIPQRAPIVMVDSILTCTDTEVTSTFHINEDNLFVSNDEMSESGMIENIAQTAAARIGIIAQQKQEPVPLGYIAAINKIKVFQLPASNSEISTTVTIKGEYMGLIVVEGQCIQGDVELLKCEMKVMIQKNESHNG